MIKREDDPLEAWFCLEILPHEAALTRFIRRNSRPGDDALDLRHDVYELALTAARSRIPDHPKAYLLTIARNYLINRAKRAQVVSFEQVADLEGLGGEADLLAAERGIVAREELRRFESGLNRLPARVRETVWLRKVEGLNARQTADRMGIGLDAVNKHLALGMKAIADFMAGGAGSIEWRSTSQARRRRSGS